MEEEALTPRRLDRARAATMIWRRRVAAGEKPEESEKELERQATASELLRYWTSRKGKKVEGVQMKGVLDCSMGGVLGRTWSARFVRLEDGELCVHSSDKEASSCRQWRLANANLDTVASTHFKSRPYVFRLVVEGNKRLFFSFHSEADKTSWKNVIQACITRTGELHPMLHVPAQQIESLAATDVTPDPPPRPPDPFLEALAPAEYEYEFPQPSEPEAAPLPTPTAASVVDGDVGKKKKPKKKKKGKEPQDELVTLPVEDEAQRFIPKLEEDLVEFKKSFESSKRDKKDGVVETVFQGWNEEFQKVLNTECETPEEYMKKGLRAHEIVNMFTRLSSVICMRMVEELALPAMHRSLIFEYEEQLIDVYDGDYGYSDTSEKVVRKFGITFTIDGGDVLLQSSDNVESSELASRLNGMEFSSLQCYLSAKVAGLQVPLQCIIDYKGHRVVARADIPMGDRSLRFGVTPSENRRKRTARNLLREAAIQMNLREHTAFFEADVPFSIPCSVELQVHRGDDRRNYVMNCARSMSPDASYKILFDDYDKVHTRLLRPEFVKSYDIALSSDAFRNVGGEAKDSETVNADVRRASLHLHDVMIPQFVKDLDALALQSRDGIYFVDSAFISKALHDHGINVRYLGKIAALTKLPHVRVLCGIEMCARAAKRLWSRLCREIISARKVEYDEDYYYVEGERPEWMDDPREKLNGEFKTAMVDFFNLVLGCSVESVRYWTDVLKVQVKQRFRYDVSPETICVPALFRALQYHCGCIFRGECDYDFDSAENPLSKDDFVVFMPKIKQYRNFGLPIDDAYKNARKLEAENKFSESLREFDSVLRIEQMSMHGYNSLESAKLLNEVAKVLLADEYLEAAYAFSMASLGTVKISHCGYHTYSSEIYSTLLRCKRMLPNADTEVEVARIMDSAENAVKWHSGIEHPILIGLYTAEAEMLVKARQYNLGLPHLENAVAVAERSLGRSHPETIKMFMRLAKVKVEMGKKKKDGDNSLRIPLASDVDGEGNALEEGIAILRKAYAICEDNTLTKAEAALALAEALLEKKHFEESILLMKRVMKIRETILGADNDLTIDTLKRYAEVCELGGHLHDAADAREVLLDQYKRVAREVSQDRKQGHTDGDDDDEDEVDSVFRLDLAPLEVADLGPPMPEESELTAEEKKQNEEEEEKEAERLAHLSQIMDEVKQETNRILRLRLMGLSFDRRAIVDSALNFTSEQDAVPASRVREVVSELWKDTPSIVLGRYIDDVAMEDEGESTPYEKLATLFQLVTEEEIQVEEEKVVEYNPFATMDYPYAYGEDTYSEQGYPETNINDVQQNE